VFGSRRVGRDRSRDRSSIRWGIVREPFSRDACAGNFNARAATLRAAANKFSPERIIPIHPTVVRALMPISVIDGGFTRRAFAKQT
jgi:hypothetical protein